MNRLKGTAWLASLLVCSSAGVLPVFGQAPAAEQMIAPTPVWQENETQATRVHVFYVDPAGYQIGYEALDFPGDADHTVELSDLNIPEGFVLDEEYQPVTVAAGDFSNLNVQVNSANPKLAEIYASQNKDENRSVITFNYWTEDGNLVDSETEPLTLDGAAGGLPTISLYQDYTIDVPKGYQLITPAPETLQDYFYDSRTIVDLQVKPVNDTAAGSTSSASPDNSTSASAGDASSAKTSSSSAQEDKGPDTGISLGAAVYSGLFLAAAGGLDLAGLKLRGKKH